MDIRIDEKNRFAHIRLSGPLTRQAILGAFDAAVSDDRYKPGMGRLWDFRDADLSSLDASVIPEMTRYPEKFPPGISDVRVAFVASRDLEYGLSRMFEAYSEAPSTISVFYSIEEAEAWFSAPAGGQEQRP